MVIKNMVKNAGRAYVLGLVCSGRRKGYSASTLEVAIEGAEEVKGVETEIVYLQDYTIRPCTSCFNCIRNEAHACTLKDDLGRNGKGTIYQKVERSNGLIISDPVHMWACSAQCHLFFERLYPFFWQDHLNGIPLLSFSVASNQGFHFQAITEICRWAALYKMWSIGLLPVHAAHLEEAKNRARELGGKLAEAAVSDLKKGRKKMSDEEQWQYYLNKPWNILDHYVENLTNATYEYKASVIKQALTQKTFKDKDAISLLQKADIGLKEAIEDYKQRNREKAVKKLVELTAYWTHATWKEFLEKQVIKKEIVKTYRPLREDKEQS